MIEERNHTGEYLKSLDNSLLSFEQITVTGGKFAAGTVMSETATEGVYGEADAGAENHCILHAAVDASASNETAIALMRLAVVKADYLEWPDDFTAANKATVIKKLKSAVMLIVQ